MNEFMMHLKWLGEQQRLKSLEAKAKHYGWLFWADAYYDWDDDREVEPEPSEPEPEPPAEQKAK